MSTRKKAEDEMPAEIDFSRLGPPEVGKYYERAIAGAPLIRLAPDVATAFPTERAVNAALRGLLRQKVARATGKVRRRKRAQR